MKKAARKNHFVGICAGNITVTRDYFDIRMVYHDIDSDS